MSTRRSSKDCFISYGSNRYSIPSPHALSQLTVRETPEGILEVYAGLECITTHTLSSGHHQTIVNPAHFEALWQALGKDNLSETLVAPGPRIGPQVSDPEVEVRALSFYEALAEGEDLS